MTKASKPKRKVEKPQSVEVEPDAWARFERAVKRLGKVPPQQRKMSQRAPRTTRKGK